MKPLKLSFSTLGCPKWSFEQVLQNAQEMGFSAIEVRGIQGELDTPKVWCFLPENQQRTEELLREYDISILGIGTSCNFHTKEKYEAAMVEGREAIDIATRMNIPYIRVFGNNLPENQDREETIAMVAKGIEELCLYAKENGNVGVLLEIHGDFNTIESVSPLLDTLKKQKNFGIIWDVEHSYTSYDQDFNEFYQLIKPYIRHVHFKDSIRAKDSKTGKRAVQLMGEGKIPLAAIFNTLSKDNYNGYYSFEWEKVWIPELPEPEIAFPHFIEYMKQLASKA